MLENLVELRLANNDHVTEIDTSAWGSTPMTKLKVLKLDSNALLRSVPEALVDGLPQLEEVSLQNLSLKCDCNLRWIREWAELRDYVTFHLTNSECVNALSPGLTPVTDVKTEEMVCEAPYVVTSSVNSGHLPDFAQLKVTISNVGLPVVTWELPNGDIFGLGTHRPSTNDTTLVIINTTVVSTVLVCTLNISNITTNFYGQYVMTATNMAGNVTQSLVLEEVSRDVNLADLPRVQLTVSLVSVVAVVFLLGMICFINLHHTNEQRFQRLSAEKSNDNNSTEDAQQGTGSMSDVEAVIENLDSRTFLQKEKAVATIAGEHNNPGFEQDDEFTRL
ncbi:leucine-rich repeat-containing protein 4B-like [Liolophura sinensis]|uniref:leucine-rich repeat-containing protein 4B-like n=1 Tax=Liolophura sinensis TaxID=3198878 RepID=UPI003158488B